MLKNILSAVSSTVSIIKGTDFTKINEIEDIGLLKKALRAGISRIESDILKTRDSIKKYQNFDSLVGSDYSKGNRESLRNKINELSSEIEVDKQNIAKYNKIEDAYGDFTAMLNDIYAKIGYGESESITLKSNTIFEKMTHQFSSFFGRVTQYVLPNLFDSTRYAPSKEERSSI